jgi:replicative superfamily II helicase
MARKSLEEQKEELLKKQKQIQKRLKDLSSRENAKKRKDDTRRKIILGAICQHHAELKPEFKKWLADEVRKSLSKQRDIDLFADLLSEAEEK